MSKNHKQPSLLPVEDAPIRSFYYPHTRAQTWYTGEVTNPVTGEVTRPPSMTKQSFVAECDINNIMKQYKATGIISHISANARQGVYTDLPDSLDFQASLELVKEAQIAFASLPSKVRDRFGNDPAAFLAFCGDPRNAKEMAELGLTIPSNPTPVPDAGGSGSKPPAKPPAPPAAPAPSAPQPDA